MISIFTLCAIIRTRKEQNYRAPVRKKVTFVGDTCRGHAAVVDRSCKNLGEHHSYIVKSSATLKDRAELNMKAWFGFDIS
jgi:hypothetical protein